MNNVQIDSDAMMPLQPDSRVDGHQLLCDCESSRLSRHATFKIHEIDIFIASSSNPTELLDSESALRLPTTQLLSAAADNFNNIISPATANNSADNGNTTSNDDTGNDQYQDGGFTNASSTDNDININSTTIANNSADIDNSASNDDTNTDHAAELDNKHVDHDNNQQCANNDDNFTDHDHDNNKQQRGATNNDISRDQRCCR